jgi:hypothetical protein
MTLQPIRLNICACCGFDVARIRPAPCGFRVSCDPESGGCGAESDHALTEAEAVARWNNSELAASVLRAAEIRKRERAA